MWSQQQFYFTNCRWRRRLFVAAALLTPLHPFSPQTEKMKEAKPRYKQDVDVVWTQSELWWGAGLGGGVRGLSESVSRRSLTQSGF